jgi:hypothetical protein
MVKSIDVSQVTLQRIEAPPHSASNLACSKKFHLTRSDPGPGMLGSYCMGRVDLRKRKDARMRAVADAFEKKSHLHG